MNFSKKKCLKRVLQNVTVIHDVRIRPDVRKNILRKILYFIMIFFFSNLVTPGQMPQRASLPSLIITVVMI